jgi:glucose-6-phosphate 1-dehydrogenase
MVENKKYNIPTAIVIFGGTGDLAQTKLFPALFDLFRQNALPASFAIVGISRKDMDDSQYQTFVRESINKKEGNDQGMVDLFCSHFRYVIGDFDNIDTYTRLKETLKVFDTSLGQCTSKLFYLAVPPNFYNHIFTKLKESDAMALCDGVGSWSRLLVEKPFGRDLATADALEQQLQNLFSEDQIYRIDHYLAKDAIENILALRFSNSVLANSWNKEYIESIDIRLLETKNVANRGSFYDGIGALRDVGQNHMLQMLALLTMRNVNTRDATSMRHARTQALQSLARQKPKNFLRGQYKGFIETEGVDKNSETETYFKIETEIDTDAWRGVTFTLEAGKALDKNITEAIVTFRALDTCLCAFEPSPHKHKNVLRITFSPEQSITLTVWVKKPGFDFVLEERELELIHEKNNQDTHSPEAYERVLFDCIVGDQTRFVSGEEVTAAWQFITPILTVFDTKNLANSFTSLPLYSYEPGSTGPLTN